MGAVAGNRRKKIVSVPSTVMGAVAGNQRKGMRIPELSLPTVMGLLLMVIPEPSCCYGGCCWQPKEDKDGNSRTRVVADNQRKKIVSVPSSVMGTVAGNQRKKIVSVPSAVMRPVSGNQREGMVILEPSLHAVMGAIAGNGR